MLQFFVVQTRRRVGCIGVPIDLHVVSRLGGLNVVVLNRRLRMPDSVKSFTTCDNT